MTSRRFARSTVALAGCFLLANVGAADDPKKTTTAWGLEEASAQLAFHPKDPYLQYVVLQLSRRANREEDGIRAVERGQGLGPWQGRGRGTRIDLFSTFTGALAIQESLQLDTMRGQANRNPPAAPKRNLPDKVAIGKLVGPTVVSHPWDMLLANKKPDVGTLANCVPDDFWFAEFRSLAKLNEVMGLSELWGGHIFTQALGEAKSQTTIERIKKQLGVSGQKVEVDGIAIAGSDLFLAEGSDVSLLVQSQKQALLKLLDIGNGRDLREQGEFNGIPYVHRWSRDGRLNVYSANPRPDLHVRSNSLLAFKRVLECVSDKPIEGKPVRRLGDSLEFQYIRTLMPRAAAEEDGLIYLSDPFIRRLVGPQLKLTERRRVLVYNHLRMIGHACLLFRTEHGRAPKSLEELAETKCAPGVFGAGDLAHPDGGTYSLSADGMSGACSKWGRAEALAPCLEHLVAEVSGAEAEEYRNFVAEYSQYWRTYFDPIAIRAAASAKQYRLETLVLPLIDNSIYTTMAQLWGGQAVPLDLLPTGQREIGGLYVHFPKGPLLDVLGPEVAKKPEPGREVAKSRVSVKNDLRQLALAMHNYESVNGRLPPRGVPGKDGKPLLSWRVLVLPYIDQEPLYKEFHLDEPWDSEHNKKLIAKMPALFRAPNKKLIDQHKTVYLVPVEKSTMFPPDGKKVRLLDITDGTSNTIMLVEANDDAAVIWTKPDDLSVDLAKPFRGLEQPGAGDFAVATGDGSVFPITSKGDPRSMAAAFTRDGGEAPAIRQLSKPASTTQQPDRPKTANDVVNDLQLIALAMHNYNDTFGYLPPAGSRDKNGKTALLSWRVALLPFIEQGQLYREFRLDEPWDSEHNKALIARMPRIFQGANAKLNELGKTTYLVPSSKETMFPPTGEKSSIPKSIPDGLSNTIMVVQSSDDAAVIWTKPDDLPVDLKKPMQGLERPGQGYFLVVMADGGVRKFRSTIDPSKVAAMFTPAGGEVIELRPEDAFRLPGNRQQPAMLFGNFLPSEQQLQQLESLGFDLNKLRRLLKTGIGDQVGFQMYDGAKPLDYDIAAALAGQNGDGFGLGRPMMFGLGIAIQFLTGAWSISIPVNDAKAVDEFLDELDRFIVKLKAGTIEDGFRPADFTEFYRLPFPKPFTVRCGVIKFGGLKWRLFWGRLGDGLYIANRPAVLEQIAAAQNAATPRQKPESANAMLRLRPANWREALPGYHLSWAEQNRLACHDNLSLIANVNRGWNERRPANGAPDAELLERVARLYGARPFCPEGGAYTLSADGRSCACSIHGTERDPRQPVAPAEGSTTARLLKSLAGIGATLTFHEDGLRAVVTIERKE